MQDSSSMLCLFLILKAQLDEHIDRSLIINHSSANQRIYLQLTETMPNCKSSRFCSISLPPILLGKSKPEIVLIQVR